MGHQACDRFEVYPVPARACVSEAIDRAGHELCRATEWLVCAGYTSSGSSNETFMGFLLWAALGASVGYVAAQRRDFSTAIGVLAGLALGPLAVVLFFVPLSLSRPGQPRACQYCAGKVPSDARVCHHCHALLQSGGG